MKRPLLELAALGMIGCAQETTPTPITATPEPEVEVVKIEIPEPEVEPEIEIEPTPEPEPQIKPKCDLKEIFDSTKPSRDDLARYWESNWPEIKPSSIEGPNNSLIPNITSSKKGDFIFTTVCTGFQRVSPCPASVYANGQKLNPLAGKIMWEVLPPQEKTIIVMMTFGRKTKDPADYNTAYIPYPNIEPLCQ